MVESLQEHSADPNYFLGRQAAFARSSISAQKWLAEVLDDHHSNFEQNQVEILFPSESAAAPRSELQMPVPRVTARPISKPRATAGRTIALVSCVSKKSVRPMPARDLYISDWFQKASAYVEQTADRWYILSAKYGLVDPDAVIEPYDETLKTMPAAARRAWARRVLVQLSPSLKQGDHLVILAGEAYREHLLDPVRAIGYPVEIPMQGLRIGEQLRWLTDQLRIEPDSEKPTGRLDDVRRFYRILDRLEARLGGRRVLGECDGRMEWPERGVYFFFEPGENRTSSGARARVVRVDTHALQAGSKSTLWGCLRQHRGTVAYGGNHRGSVFRRHVGAALIRRHRWPESMTGEWGQGSSASQELRESEGRLEKAVSWHLQHMPVLWLGVGDDPGPDSVRGTIERNAIALLSNTHSEEKPIDPPSDTWLGRWADREEVRRSGLWNVNHLDEGYDPGFLDLFEQHVDGVPGRH